MAAVEVAAYMYIQAGKMTQSRKSLANSHRYASSRVKLSWLVVIILMALVLFYYFTYYYYSATDFWTVLRSSHYQKRGRTRLISTDLYKQTAEKAREQRPELSFAELIETDAYSGTDAVETDYYIPASE